MPGLQGAPSGCVRFGNYLGHCLATAERAPCARKLRYCRLSSLMRHPAASLEFYRSQ